MKEQGFWHPAPWYWPFGGGPTREPKAQQQLDALEKAQKQLQASQAALEKKKRELQAARENSDTADAKRKQAEAELKRIRIPHLDVVIALDITGSMSKQIEGLKKEIVQLVSVLDKLAPSVGIGIVVFGDRNYQQAVFTHDITEITKSRPNLGALQNFVNRIRKQMGMGSGKNNDGPEAVDQALDAAIGMRWRSQAERKYIIIVTDNPVYPDRVQYTFDRAEGFARSGNQHVSTVQVGTDAKARAYLEGLAGKGNGQVVRDGGSMTASVLMAILQK